MRNYYALVYPDAHTCDGDIMTFTSKAARDRYTKSNVNADIITSSDARLLIIDSLTYNPILAQYRPLKLWKLPAEKLVFIYNEMM